MVIQVVFDNSLSISIINQTAINPRTTKPATGPIISPVVRGMPADLWKMVLRMISGTRRTSRVSNGDAMTYPIGLDLSTRTAQRMVAGVMIAKSNA